MSAQILDGKALAAQIRQEVKQQVEELFARHSVRPGLATVLVGENPASKVYVSMKQKACLEAGMQIKAIELPEETSEAQLIELIHHLNEDPALHGILVQHPLPKHINEARVFDEISPRKDVDGLTSFSLGCLAAGEINFAPCTPAGIIELLDRYQIQIEGKDAVVVGRSRINGRPAALLLLMRHATVTVCHTRTKDLADKTRRADLLIAACGKPEMITGEMVKEGAIVIDTGYNRLPDRKGDVGDVHFESASKVASYITPVPGGVGPMTVAMLLKNVLEAARRHVERA